MVVPCNMTSHLWMTGSLLLSREVALGELGYPTDTSAPYCSPFQVLLQTYRGVASLCLYGKKHQLEIAYQVSPSCWTPKISLPTTIMGEKSCHHTFVLWDIVTWHSEMYEVRKAGTGSPPKIRAGNINAILWPEVTGPITWRFQSRLTSHPYNTLGTWSKENKFLAKHRIANPGSKVFPNPAHHLITNPDYNWSLTQNLGEL